MKKIIFFDADGTLWYPRSTKYSERPWWVYFDDKTKSDPLRHLVLIPGVKDTLKKLKRKGLTLVLISQVPYSKRHANEKMVKATKHFGIYELFDQIRSSHSSIRKGRPDPKDLAILEVLKKRNMPKSSALLVGDSYIYDYLAAKRCGIDCVLLHGFKNTKADKNYRRVRKKSEDINGIFKYLD